MDQQKLLLLLVIIANLNKNKENNQLHILSEYIRNIKVDPLYTEEKIKIAKKIAPLIPEEYNYTVTRSIMLAEKIVRILDLVEFLNTPEENYSIEPVHVSDNKERISKIMATIQQEAPKSRVNNYGMVMDLLVNMDKYKIMLETFSSLMSNPDMLKDSKGIMKIMETFMQNSSIDNAKLKEMSQMMQIIKALDSPKRKTHRRK